MRPKYYIKYNLKGIIIDVFNIFYTRYGVIWVNFIIFVP